MTASNDLDRLLGEWLDEGPRRAPDRPLELALENARAHPRRPDPLGFLRPDAMAPRRAVFGLRPVLVLAALALVLAAVAVGGGAFRESVQPPLPPPSTSPSPIPSPTGPPLPLVFDVDLVVAAGEPQTVSIVDDSGLLVEARSGEPSADGRSFPDDAVDVTNLDETTLRLGWSGFPCATDHALTIDEAARVFVLARPACRGETDAIGVDRILILRFAEPVDAADVEITLEG